MKKEETYFKKKHAITMSILTAFILMMIFLLIINMYSNNIKQQELLKTTDRFITFKSQVERLIDTNRALVQGYVAYILTNPDLDEEEAYRYLDNLLLENKNQIRNIAVCEDTTIIWNYPKENNMVAIGVDLSKVENQKNAVLKVKNELVSVLQGPVELVQGGSAFMIRIPIVRKDTGYWGQVSMVLECDKIFEEINTYAENAGLNIAIFNSENKSLPFLGSISSVGETPLSFDIDPDFIDWRVIVSPKEGFKKNWFILGILFFGTSLIAIFAGLLAFIARKRNYQLRVTSSHDALTGLYNRYYLNEYQSMVLETAKRNKRRVGFLSMDINCFKKINDTYGHSVGDLVLIETARILKKNTRKNETVFRLGGDEFLMIMPDIEDRGILEQAQKRLTMSFKNEFKLEEYSEKIEMSIGMAIFPDHGDYIDVLLQVADKQMYMDKKKQKTIV